MPIAFKFFCAIIYGSVDNGGIVLSDIKNREHLTYERIKEEYEDAKRKRVKYKRFGFLYIIISGIVFLTLMFSVDSKIAFLVLWVITDFACAAIMIHADYRYHTFADYLGIEDEYSQKPESE